MNEKLRIPGDLAELRDIFDEAARPQGRLKLGSHLAQVGREMKLTDEEFSLFESVRDRSAARAASLE